MNPYPETLPLHDPQTLLPLIARVREAETSYALLSGAMTGRDAALLRRLQEHAQGQVACLKGVYALLSGKRVRVETPPPKTEPVMHTLKKCYTRELQLFSEYDGWADIADYGHVFVCLARQSREHCAVLLEILGRL